jgi:hypothetical protein
MVVQLKENIQPVSDNKTQNRRALDGCPTDITRRVPNNAVYKWLYMLQCKKRRGARNESHGVVFGVLASSCRRALYIKNPI